MQCATHSDAHLHREHLQRYRAPAGGEPKGQVIFERTLNIDPLSRTHPDGGLVHLARHLTG